MVACMRFMQTYYTSPEVGSLAVSTGTLEIPRYLRRSRHVRL